MKTKTQVFIQLPGAAGDGLNSIEIKARRREKKMLGSFI